MRFHLFNAIPRVKTFAARIQMTTKGKTALAQVASLSNLEEAWEHIWKNSKKQSKNSLDLNNISLNDFNHNKKQLLKKISKKLSDRCYVFNDLHPFLVPKSNGKYRLICVPTIEDRVVQRALLNVLNNYYHNQLDNGISYGFITKKTVKDAARKACELRKTHKWVYKTDITAFFDNVDREKLKEKTKSLVKHRSLHPLLFSIINREVRSTSNSQALRIKKLGIRRGHGVRQGMPLSPFFANLFLGTFDNEIKANGFSAVRYADDLIFFAKSKHECEQIDSFCRTSLKKLDLDIPLLDELNSKTVIYNPDETVEFLGLGLSKKKCNADYELILTNEQLQMIRTELLQLGSIKQLLDSNIKLANLGSAIESRIAGYKAAYSDCITNYTELENHMIDLHQKVLHRIYGVGGLNINLSSLSSENRRFLGLT